MNDFDITSADRAGGESPRRAEHLRDGAAAAQAQPDPVQEGAARHPRVAVRGRGEGSSPMTKPRRRGCSRTSCGTGGESGPALGRVRRCSIARTRSGRASRACCCRRAYPAASRRVGRCRTIRWCGTSWLRSGSSRQPGDPVPEEALARVVLPETLYQRIRTEARDGPRPSSSTGCASRRGAGRRRIPEIRKLRRFRLPSTTCTRWGGSIPRINGLVDELLAQRVGEYRTLLEERHEELTDPRGRSRCAAPWPPSS